MEFVDVLHWIELEGHEKTEEKLILGFLLLMKFEHTHAHLKAPRTPDLFINARFCSIDLP